MKHTRKAIQLGGILYKLGVIDYEANQNYSPSSIQYISIYDISRLGLHINTYKESFTRLGYISSNDVIVHERVSAYQITPELRNFAKYAQIWLTGLHNSISLRQYIKQYEF